MMLTHDPYFLPLERKQLLSSFRRLLANLYDTVTSSDIARVKSLITQAVSDGRMVRDAHGFNPTLRHLNTASLLVRSFVPDRNMAIAVMLYDLCLCEALKLEDVERLFGDDIALLVGGLLKVSRLYAKQAAVTDENFSKLLLTFATDIRVVIIMIVDRLALLYMINHHPDEQYVKDVASEARYLYAPLAHRLGLYNIKSELEDISLKYLDRKIYTQIATRLKDTKAERDQYVVNFTQPIIKALDNAGLKYDIKGRTKTINSIWNKMKNKHVDLKEVYDLFAIRIIIDTPVENEKRACWLAYSIVTDIYTANPSRMRDWITIPKGNGYESLHITVSGPDDKWVEVQIRTRRMDDVAEHGLAAHWKYKGIKSEKALDALVNNVREVLEAGKEGQMELIKGMHMNIYDDEVFVFTPRGDVFRLPQGASVIDFAFAVHTRVGYQCVGGKVNGKNQKLNYRLKNGDTVEIVTSSTQMPRQDWLKHVVTSKARNKIKAALNEQRMRLAGDGRELLQRRLRNRKIELDESVMMRLMKKMGYKTATDFLVAIGSDTLPVNTVIEHYDALLNKGDSEAAPSGTAQDFVLHTVDERHTASDDILLIDDSLKGINYRLSKCCNPVFGDSIVGFVASSGIIKVHRTSCKNMKHLLSRYPYRRIRCAWTGKDGALFRASLHVVGLDEMGVLSNITSVINKTEGASLRGVNINTRGASFEGSLAVTVTSIAMLDDIIKRIKSLRGVQAVNRM